MELADFFAAQTSSTTPIEANDMALLLAAFHPKSARRGETLVRQGEANDREYVLLSGRAVSIARDAEGRETCVGIYQAPCAITPNFVRSAGRTSLVSLELLDEAKLADTTADQLAALMVQSAGIRDWANGVAQGELSRKAAREWCLAVLSAKERLAWFRPHYAGYEEAFAHRYIASFLGITPVTLSRARNG